MRTSTNEYLDKTITDEENRNRREKYKTRPYANKVFDVHEYESAYGHGVESYTKNPDRTLDDVDSDFSRNWNALREKSSGDRERSVSRDAWDLYIKRR